MNYQEAFFDELEKIAISPTLGTALIGAVGGGLAGYGGGRLIERPGEKAQAAMRQRLGFKPRKSRIGPWSTLGALGGAAAGGLAGALGGSMV